VTIMLNPMKTFYSLFAVFVLALSGLAKEESRHAHTAPHGGTLVELGDHQYNLELVRDAAAGTLMIYILDAHAENFVRVPLKSIEVSVRVGERPEKVSLAATANALSGETVGDTSQFTGSAAWLKGKGEFNGTIAEIEIRGARFKDVAFSSR
jgi:hypothetical protein